MLHQKQEALPGEARLVGSVTELPQILLDMGENKRQNVTAQPLGSILEAKPLRQGQKTRILGRRSKNCSHLYRLQPSAVTVASFLFL